LNREPHEIREQQQKRRAHFFRDHFVSAAAGSVRHGRRQGLRVDLYSSKGSLIPWENRLDLRVASTSPLELVRAARADMHKPTHRAKHFWFCASWEDFKKSGKEKLRKK